jgi:hypothetical protein
VLAVVVVQVVVAAQAVAVAAKPLVQQTQAVAVAALVQILPHLVVQD